MRSLDEPTVKLTGHVFVVKAGEHRDKTAIGCYVEVEPMGLLNLVHQDWGFGQKETDQHKEWFRRREIIEWLIEHELAVIRAIGPDDSEWFATKKLDPEYGIE